LEGTGPAPFEYFIGRLCEEFSCLPSAAWREWQRLPAGCLEQVIEYRAFARAYQVYQANPKAQGEMVQLVKVIEFEEVQRELDAQ
jgi:hypothetical protein